MHSTISIIGLIIPVFVSGVFSILLTPIVMAVAHRKKWFDDANDPRKIHNGTIPRLGGIAIFLAFLASLGTAAVAGTLPMEGRSIALLAGAAVIFGIGLVDDFRNLRARFKFGVQLLAAVGVAAAGYRFEYLPLPGGLLALGAFSWVLTIVWIVGISNGINMIDGMDGLAGGISLIATASMGILCLALGETIPSIIAFGLAAAIVGFLFYNLPPARIFMGDSGSLFLGFCLAVLPLLYGEAHPRELSVLAAGTILGVPIFDVFAAILRRRRRGQAVMEPDREHLHHKLLWFGLDTRHILAIVYTTSLGLGVAAIAAAGFSDVGSLFILLLALAVLTMLFLVLHFLKQGRAG
ncbi:MAG: MraY family glycosyltransferase [Spirochaetota bacterium]